VESLDHLFFDNPIIYIHKPSNDMSCELSVQSVAPLCQPGTSIIDGPNPDWRLKGFTIHCGYRGVGCEHPPCTATNFDGNAKTSVVGYTYNGVRYEIEAKKGKVYHTTSQNLNPLPDWPKYQKTDTVRAMGGWIVRRTKEESTVGDASGDRQSGQGGSSTLKPSENEREAGESIQ
jgi:hypothetical protein